MKFSFLPSLTLALSLSILAACSHAKPKPDAASPPAFKSGYAPVNGLEMYYEIYGKLGGGKTPILLIHGGGSTIESNFSQMIPLLAKDRVIIAIEEQGHGHTKAIDRPFTFENSADDAAAVLDFLKIPYADVFGFSNGGSIAMRLALRHPQKVGKLIVASAMYRRDGMVKGFWDGMKNAKLEMMPKELQEADRKINPDPRHLEQLFQQDSRRMQTFRDWKDEDLRSIHAPTLILVGDRDVIRVEHALKMTRLLRKGRLAVLPSNHGNYLGEVASTKTAPASLILATSNLIQHFFSEGFAE